MKIRHYSELIRLTAFEDRFEYLKLLGSIGRETFGFDRYLNQRFYNSVEWQRVRSFVLHRDNGLNLGVEGYDIYARPIVHHMNPIRVEDFSGDYGLLLNPDFLITTTHETHNAIHYATEDRSTKPFVTRKPNDTKLW